MARRKLMVPRKLSYRPLDPNRKEIRVLTVHAHSRCPTGTVQCTMSHVSLMDNPTPRYETISYRWGDQRCRTYIIVDDCFLDVGLSAERVLRRFRREEEDVTLWIDAICINQQDEVEKSRQVAMMAEIYSKTAQGLIWLGEELETTPLANEAIRAVVEDARNESDDFWNFQDLLETENGNFRFARSPLSFNVEVFAPALLDFYSAEWFERLWIVQEATLAPQSMCHFGSIEIPISMVLVCASWLMHKARYLPLNLGQSQGILNASQIYDLADHRRKLSAKLADGSSTKHLIHFYARNWPKKSDLLSILGRLREFRASDPQDHVFALVGLYQETTMSEKLPDDLVPDYTKRVERVFKDATRFMIKERGDLEVLRHIRCRAENFGYEGLSLPSWVYSWQDPWSREYDAYDMSSSFAADHGREEVVFASNRSQDPDVLSICGITLGTVDCASGIVNDAMIRSAGSVVEALHTFKELQYAKANDDRHQKSQTALAVTLCADTDYEYQPVGNDKALAALVAYVEYLSTTGELPPTINKVLQGEPEACPLQIRLASEYDYIWWRACRNRRLFVTREAQLGLGPSLTTAQDIVVVLYGCCWPVVLRPVADGYRFLGLAYVHGIMYGEAVSKQHESETFDII